MKDRSVIRLCFADEVQYNILNEDSAGKLWLKLESLYTTKSLMNRLYLKQKLYILRMREGMGISEHLNKLIRLFVS